MKTRSAATNNKKAASKEKKNLKVTSKKKHGKVTTTNLVNVKVTNPKVVVVTAKADASCKEKRANVNAKTYTPPTRRSDEVPSLSNLSPEIWMQHILPFVGKNQYRFVGAVNRHFRLSYFTVFSTITSYENVTTMGQAYLCSNDLWTNREERSKFCKVMVKLGRHSIVKYLFSSPNHKPTCAALTTVAAEQGHFEILRWLVQKHHFSVHPETFAAAAARGDRAMLEWLDDLPYDQDLVRYRRRKVPWDDTIYDSAALHGHLDIIEWAYKKEIDLDEIVFLNSICEMTARNGHLHVLKWAHSKHFPWGNACASAAMNGQLKTLKWLRKHGCPWDESTCLKAAEFGHGEVAKWAASHGCPLKEEMCEIAAKEGNLEMLKIAHTVLEIPFCDETYWSAVENGHLHILKWLHANGCEWDIQSCQCAALNGHFEILKWLISIGCDWFDEEAADHAARSGHMEILQWAVANGAPWGEMTCAMAAYGGHLNILKWLRANGCPWDCDTYYLGIQNGYIDVLEWAFVNGCPTSSKSGCRICSWAASFNQLDVLQWARSHDIPWTDDVSSIAAEKNCWELLEWALANGCPFPDVYECISDAFKNDYYAALEWYVENKVGMTCETCAKAALDGNFKLFRWLHRVNCPWDERSCANAAKKGHLKILDFARKNGCPSKKYPIDAKKRTDAYFSDCDSDTEDSRSDHGGLLLVPLPDAYDSSDEDDFYDDMFF